MRGTGDSTRQAARTAWGDRWPAANAVGVGDSHKSAGAGVGALLARSVPGTTRLGRVDRNGSFATCVSSCRYAMDGQACCLKLAGSRQESDLLERLTSRRPLAHGHLRARAAPSRLRPQDRQGAQCLRWWLREPRAGAQRESLVGAAAAHRRVACVWHLADDRQPRGARSDGRPRIERWRRRHSLMGARHTMAPLASQRLRPVHKARRPEEMAPKDAGTNTLPGRMPHGLLGAVLAGQLPAGRCEARWLPLASAAQQQWWWRRR